MVIVSNGKHDITITLSFVSIVKIVTKYIDDDIDIRDSIHDNDHSNNQDND